jgi:hypothetical protein
MAGMSDAANKTTAADRTSGTTFDRGSGIFMDRFYRSLINAAGFPVDATNWGVNQVRAGFGYDPILNPKGGSEHLTGFYESYANNFAPALNTEAKTQLEERLATAGEFTGDVASVIVPGKAFQIASSGTRATAALAATKEATISTSPAQKELLEKGADMWRKLFESGARFAKSEAGGLNWKFWSKGADVAEEATTSGLGKKVLETAIDIYKWPFKQSYRLFGTKSIKPIGINADGGLVHGSKFSLGKRSLLTGGVIAGDGLLNEFNGTAEVLKGAVIWPLHAFSAGTSAIGSFLKGESKPSQFQQDTGTSPNDIKLADDASPEGLTRLAEYKDNLMSEWEQGNYLSLGKNLMDLPNAAMGMGSDLLKGATFDGIGGMAKNGFKSASQFVQDVTHMSPGMANLIVGFGAFMALKSVLATGLRMSGLGKLPFAGLAVTVGAGYLAFQLANSDPKDVAHDVNAEKTASLTEATPALAHG